MKIRSTLTLFQDFYLPVNNYTGGTNQSVYNTYSDNLQSQTFQSLQLCPNEIARGGSITSADFSRISSANKNKKGVACACSNNLQNRSNPLQNYCPGTLC